MNTQLILVDIHKDELLGFLSMHSLFFTQFRRVVENYDNSLELSLNRRSAFYLQEESLHTLTFPRLRQEESLYFD